MKLNHQQIIETKIYSIYRVKVMHDRDIGQFYEVKPIRLLDNLKKVSI